MTFCLRIIYAQNQSWNEAYLNVKMQSRFILFMREGLIIIYG